MALAQERPHTVTLAARPRALRVFCRTVAAGYEDEAGSNQCLVARYLKKGTLDTSFGRAAGTPGFAKFDFGNGSGLAYAVAVQSDGKIVTVGQAANHFAQLVKETPEKSVQRVAAQKQLTSLQASLARVELKANAFYTYFRSDRQGVLFHPLGGGAEWRPFECPAVERALAQARDAQDRQFLEFLARNYCAGDVIDR